MKAKSIILVGVVLGLVGAAGLFYWRQASAASREILFSGTIEATEINLPTLAGGRVTQVNVDQGDPIRAGQDLVDNFSPAGQVNEQVTAPIDGIVLERLVEPGEYAAPGSTELVVASLDALTLTIYVPENRYGQIALGQSFPVTVDSFPGISFRGTVKFISTQAQFTPRNVQTKDSRQTTVYAVKLALDPSSGKLKPGMPADVHFGD